MIMTEPQAMRPSAFVLNVNDTYTYTFWRK